jgi:hypothetical protein
VTSDAFLASLGKLDATRRLLALNSVAAAFERLATPAARRTRLVWTDAMRDRLREAARRLPDDKAIASELGLPVGKVRPMRHALCGKRSTPHITARGPRRLPEPAAGGEARARLSC